MKEYMKPELAYVDFTAEETTTMTNTSSGGGETNI